MKSHESYSFDKFLGEGVVTKEDLILNGSDELNVTVKLTDEHSDPSQPDAPFRGELIVRLVLERQTE